MEEPADSLTRLELTQKHKVNSTGASISLDFKSLIWVELRTFPARLGEGAGGLSPDVFTWGSQSLPLHHLKNFKKNSQLSYLGEGKELPRILRRNGSGQWRDE